MADQDTPERTGEERVIRDDLSQVDQEVNDSIQDRPDGNREERRRGNFIDRYGDEDNNPNTDEATYRRNNQQ
jgi:hypothetical protein